jgi:hypothetical protein
MAKLKIRNFGHLHETTDLAVNGKGVCENGFYSRVEQSAR